MLAEWPGLVALRLLLPASFKDDRDAFIATHRRRQWRCSVRRGCVVRYECDDVAGKSKWLGLVQQNGVYSRLEPADILLLRTDFEVIVVSGHAFFWKKSTIERAFGFLDKLKAESLANFNAVTTHLRRRGVRHQRCLRFESMDGRARSGRLAPAFLDMQSCNPQRIQS